jgi:hypothetical protein
VIVQIGNMQANQKDNYTHRNYMRQHASSPEGVMMLCASMSEEAYQKVLWKDHQDHQLHKLYK